MGGGEAGDNGPDKDQTGRDLHERSGEGRADEAEEDMDDLEGGEGLDGGEHGPREGVRRRDGTEERGKLCGERVGTGGGGAGTGRDADEGAGEDGSPAEGGEDIECDEIHDREQVSDIT